MIPIDDAISPHARRRLAQRNLNPEDVAYVLAHGRAWHAAKARFVHLGRRDIPPEDRLTDRYRRLEGTIVVLVADDGWRIATVYRNRERGFRAVKHKKKWDRDRPAPAPYGEDDDR